MAPSRRAPDDSHLGCSVIGGPGRNNGNSSVLPFRNCLWVAPEPAGCLGRATGAPSACPPNPPACHSHSRRKDTGTGGYRQQNAFPGAPRSPYVAEPRCVHRRADALLRASPAILPAGYGSASDAGRRAATGFGRALGPSMHNEARLAAGYLGANGTLSKVTSQRTMADRPPRTRAPVRPARRRAEPAGGADQPELTRSGNDPRRMRALDSARQAHAADVRIWSSGRATREGPKGRAAS